MSSTLPTPRITANHILVLLSVDSRFTLSGLPRGSSQPDRPIQKFANVSDSTPLPHGRGSVNRAARVSKRFLTGAADHTPGSRGGGSALRCRDDPGGGLRSGPLHQPRVGPLPTRCLAGTRRRWTPHAPSN